MSRAQGVPLAVPLALSAERDSSRCHEGSARYPTMKDSPLPWWSVGVPEGRP